MPSALLRLRELGPDVAIWEGDALAEDESRLDVLRATLGAEIDGDVVALDGSDGLELKHQASATQGRSAARESQERGR